MSTFAIGRAGRAVASGDALTLMIAEDANHVIAIERFINQKIARVKLENFDYRYKALFEPDKPWREERLHGQRPCRARPWQLPLRPRSAAKVKYSAGQNQRNLENGVMRYGINTFLFTSPFTNDSTKLFRQFKQWGFDTIEIPIEDPAHIDPAHVKRELDRHGLVCGSICACMGPDRDLRGTPQQQKTGLAYMMTLIDQMVVLGCPSLIGPVYSAVGRADAVPADEYKQQWSTVVKHLKTLCRYAEKRGKQVCLEPLNRFETDFINTCDQGLKMIKAVGSPALRLHLDTFHMNIEEKNQAAAIRKAGKHLGHFHACGSDRGTPGNDHIDWKPIAKALKDIGYQADVVIESFTTDVKVIAKAAAIWRRMEPTRNEIAVKGLKNLHKIFGRSRKA